MILIHFRRWEKYLAVFVPENCSRSCCYETQFKYKYFFQQNYYLIYEHIKWTLKLQDFIPIHKILMLFLQKQEQKGLFSPCSFFFPFLH